MKYAAVLLTAVLFVLTFNTHAQINPSYTLPQVSEDQPTAGPELAPTTAPTYALAEPSPAPLFAASPLPASPGANNASSAQQPSVYQVYQQYSWQIYAGYSFFRFYVASKPDLTENMNGLDLGVTYFFPKIEWLGIEGQFVDEYGSFYGDHSQFDLGMGGARFRWALPRALVIWAHVLGGYSLFIPQTAFGNQNAWAYEAGGGLDIGPTHRRFGFRVEADLVGTRYFGTYQDSPRFSVGAFFRY